jgi:Zn-dependent protease/CBS domain-containing protein
MNANLRIGTVWNIPITIDYSWFIIFVLMSWSLASGYFPAEFPGLPAITYGVISVLTSLLFFFSVVLHELGHSWVALHYHIPVRNISLFIFGGISQIEDEPHTAGAEFRIAIAGPLTSLILALFFGGLFLLFGSVPYLAAPGAYLMRINGMLSLFNLIPGFPLDGGRVLRSIVWKINGNKYFATNVAASTGQLVAFGFIGFGILRIFQNDFLNGVWLAFIGWYLQRAAVNSQQQSSLEHALNNVKVRQVMQKEHPQVSSLLTLRQLVDEYVLNGGQRYFCVTDPQDRWLGCITLQDISKIPQQQWDYTGVEKITIPLDKLITVLPDAYIVDAFKIMDRADVSRVPVVEDEKIVGILAREDVLHYIRIRSELGI